MAPKRKPSNSAATAAAPIDASAVEGVVRRSTRLAKATVSPPAADQEPPKKKKTKTKTAAAKEEAEAAKPLPIPAVKELSPEPKPEPKKKQTKTKTKTKTAAAKEEAEAETKPLPIPAVKELSPEPEPKKKQTKTKTKTKTKSAAAKEEAEAEAEAEAETKTLPIPAVKELSPEPDAVEGSKTIVIEHCKQCNAFKTRAIQVKDALEKDVAGVSVVLNPEKPRRGCFEIREEGGEVFVSLLDMKRPFPPLKKLDMEQLISDIIQKIQ